MLGSSSGQYLVAVDCSDADSGSNGEVSASVSEGDTDHVFYVDGLQLYVNGSEVDYERNTNHVYTLVLKVTDLPTTDHPHTTAVLVSVTVCGLYINRCTVCYKLIVVVGVFSEVILWFFEIKKYSVHLMTFKDL